MRISPFYLLLIVGACAHSSTDGAPTDNSPKTARPDAEPPDPIGDGSDEFLDGATGTLPGDGEDAEPGVDASDAGADADADIDTGVIIDAGHDAASTTSVNISWNRPDVNFVYALDVQDGSNWVHPCLSDAILGSSASTTYNGVCTSAGNQAVPHPAAYRLYFANAAQKAANSWTDFVEQPPATSVVFSLPTTPAATVPVSWNKISSTARYSLDIFVNGTQIGPCINDTTLAMSTSWSFTGKCTAPTSGHPSGQTVNIGQITEFRIYWKEPSGNWGDPGTWKGVPFNGLGRKAVILNP